MRAMHAPTVWLLGLWGTLCASAAVALVETAVEPTGDLMLLPRATRTIQIDGKLDEWDFAKPALVYRQATMVPPHGVMDPPTHSDDDISGAAVMCWDDRFVYFAGRVRDNERTGHTGKERISGGYGQGGLGPPWTYDGFMVAFKPAGWLYATRRFTPTKIYPLNPDALFGLNYYTKEAGPRTFAHGSRYVVRDTAEGYVVEAALAFKDFGARARVGDRIALGTILVDHDRTESAPKGKRPTRFSQLCLYWHHLIPVRLVGPERVSGELFATRRAFGPNHQLVLRGRLDGLETGARLEALWLKNAKGGVVRTAKVGRDARPGHTAQFTARWDRAGLAPGAYVAGMTVWVGSKRLAAPITTAVQLAGASAGGGKPMATHRTPDVWRFAFAAQHQRPWRGRVTRDDYLHYFKQVYAALERHILSDARPNHPARWGCVRGAWMAAMYKMTGEVKYAKTALQLMKNQMLYLDNLKGDWYVPGESTSAWVIGPRWIWDCPAFTDADREFLRKMHYVRIARHMDRRQTRRERGAMNRPLHLIEMLHIALVQDPTLPEAAGWRQYIDLIWNDWWQHRDLVENSTNYNPLSLDFIFDMATFGGKKEVYTDPGVKTMMERWLHEVAPSGLRAHYGDSSGLASNLGMWIHAFERWANATGDGRFKWAARRMFGWFLNRRGRPMQTSLIDHNLAWHMIRCYIEDDPKVKPVRPKHPSCLTTHHRALYMDVFERRKRGFPNAFDLSREIEPDKLVFTSGRGGRDPYALVDVVSAAGHGHHHPGNIICYTSQDSILLSQNGYMDRAAKYHNTFTIEDLEGVVRKDVPGAVTVGDFTRSALAVYAKISVEQAHGLPVTTQREILWLRRRVMIVRDRARFPKPMLCRIGPNWTTRQIGPACGVNWSNTYLDCVLATGLGLGRGVQRWENPAFDLLIYNCAVPEATWDHIDESADNMWRAQPQRLTYRWRGVQDNAKPVVFTTVLLPHPPTRTGKDTTALAGAIRTLRHDSHVTVVCMGPYALRGMYDNETWWIVFNDTGKPITVGPVTTDARVAALTVRNGKVLQRWSLKGRAIHFRAR